jgi:hypothetical protein
MRKTGREGSEGRGAKCGGNADTIERRIQIFTYSSLTAF